MNYGIFTIALLAAVAPQAGFAGPSRSDSIRVEIPLKTLLSPRYGFEQKNNIDVVLYGALPNGCYTLADTVIEKAADEHTINVKQFANRETQGMCAQASSLTEQMQLVIPFTNDVSMGQLGVGTYNLNYLSEDGTLRARPLEISANITSTPDTLPYAATLAVDAPVMINAGDELKVTIRGLLNSTCTRLNDEVHVLNENDVLVLLPTVHVETGVMCAQVMIPFEKEVNLGKTPQENISENSPAVRLIHVRSMNGKALNKVVIITHNGA